MRPPPSPVNAVAIASSASTASCARRQSRAIQPTRPPTSGAEPGTCSGAHELPSSVLSEKYPTPTNPLASSRSATAGEPAARSSASTRTPTRTRRAYTACAGVPKTAKLRGFMLTFSTNPDVAEQQMTAIIFYLTAFGYIDGNFDFTEKTFVRIYIRQLVTARAQSAMPDADPKTRDEVVGKFVTHFHEVFEHIDRNVKELFDEAVADGEDVEKFVYAKLKLRSYEIFQTFDRDNQHELLRTVDELIYADGSAHPAEKKFRAELEALLDSEGTALRP